MNITSLEKFTLNEKKRMDSKNQFEFTIEGNRKAQEYLKENGAFDGVKNVDGYQQVHLANNLYHQMNRPLKSKDNGTGRK